MQRLVTSAFAAVLAAAGLVLVQASGAVAVDYPTRPPHIIVGYPAGGTTDILARLFGDWLSKRLGQQFIVENRPGAGNNLATESVVKAAADGYTLLLVNPANAVNASLYKKLNFVFLRDIDPVVGLIRVPNVMEVHPSVPVKTVAEFIAYVKANPDKVNIASSGNGTSIHLSGELFKSMTGVQMTHVPYKGGGLALTDVIAGQIQVVFATSQTGLAQAKAGRVRALAVTTPQRIAAEPDLPTIAEAGVPGYEVTNWHGLIGPKSIPRAVVDRLNGEMNKILKAKEMEERLQGDGVSPSGGTPEQLAEQIRKEIEQWRQVVTRAGVKIN